MLSRKNVLFAVVFACIAISVGGQPLFAQTNGFLQRLSGTENGLSDGARYENGIVYHPITSSEENLHLLAGFYYLNPREWKRIYQNNRHVIKNPNRLPVGKTLQIVVGENWKPLFSYDEWFRLANRNGQWQPKRSRSKAGRASKTSSPASPKTSPVQAQPEPVSSKPTAVEPQPTPVQQPSAPGGEAESKKEPPAHKEAASAPPIEEEEEVAPAF
ncbi:hypothetical protein CSA56_12485 [candidate division KSB3 bacterium]|uniref:LysM domain-containing protein n=1 Tax=candidate division KSB3 bacterium TaxID=2044937 RepID=A0A2G6KEP7_9BACT|nr:MAG: hypothetical protein CSA56_12485 [candidate division KSB3 bacterium]